jgi:antitoxin component of RelBE/YafQ-DinJ toxin-antitoxin module
VSYRKTNMSLDDETYAQLQALADRLGLSVSAFVRMMVRQAFAQQEAA